MSTDSRGVGNAVAPIVDVVLAALAIPASLVMLFYRRFARGRFPLTSKVLRKVGVFPIRRHYYEPLFDPAELRVALSDDRHLPGIDMNVPAQLAFLGRLAYASELVSLKLDVKTGNVADFYVGNGTFLPGDSDFLYQFLRATKPAKVIEIGSGHSTKIARLALLRNASDGRPARHVCIEPFEQPWLESLGDIELIRRSVEACEIEWETELAAGDLLFIDSSHMIRPQGDVLKEYLEILPRLAPGVYVHIHDIFTPRDYPHNWLERDVFFWNEQYLLEALLSHTDRYEVVAALNFLKHKHGSALNAACPYIRPIHEPGSFYMKVREDAASSPRRTSELVGKGAISVE